MSIIVKRTANNGKLVIAGDLGRRVAFIQHHHMNYLASNEKTANFFQAIDNLLTPVVGLPLNPQKDIVVITGGAKGVGSHLAAKFDSLNYKTIIIDKRYPLELKSPHNVSFYECDISDFELTRLILDDITVRFGQITVLIDAISLKSFADTDLKGTVGLKKLMRTVYAGSLNVIQHILPRMIVHDRGYIVDIASIEGKVTTKGRSLYGSIQATKFKLMQQTELTLKKYFHRNHFASNGRVRCLLVVSSEELNGEVSVDTNLAEVVFSSILHNRQGVRAMSIGTHFKLSLRELDWHWYQCFKYLSLQN
ncbi:unnamed protein product [Kluyveromyces dobzhanskii CBS 2104]|uniref:WGS project CCBQ000000000 data, contig 00017 n=1 Tax=Kluyveromyces dobzhanskii CBS 2104 TaxID=1427455 RepID=A0A0A8L8M8_9SACH|nr:unnamed protein product [Kluyveromyces dobzhanskii CBS 2104]